MSEDVIKLQDFQQRKLAVAHLVTGSKGEELLQHYVICEDVFSESSYSKHHFTGNYIELFTKRLQRNELIPKEELKLLLHLCQTADDVLIARDAIYRSFTSFITKTCVSSSLCLNRL